MAVPWLRRLVDGISWRKPWFVPGSFHVGFVMDKLALGQVFLRFSVFPCQDHLTIALHNHMSSVGWTVGPLLTAVQRHRLTPPTLTVTTTIHKWLAVCANLTSVTEPTERCGKVVHTPASYSGGLRFKSKHEDRCFEWGFSLFSSVPQDKSWDSAV
jgi:hypothetical protein